ncbi:MAG: InlB B-repeat-containing protein [Fibrobacterales bacterium]
MFRYILFTILAMMALLSTSCIFDDPEKAEDSASSSQNSSFTLAYIIETQSMNTNADSIVSITTTGTTSDTLKVKSNQQHIAIEQFLGQSISIEYQLYTAHTYIGKQVETFVVDTASLTPVGTHYTLDAKPVNLKPIVSLPDTLKVMVGDAATLTPTWSDDDAAVTFSSLCSETATPSAASSTSFECSYSSPGTYSATFTVTDAFHSSLATTTVIAYPDPTKRVNFSGSFSANGGSIDSVSIIITGDSLLAPTNVPISYDIANSTYKGFFDIRRPGQNYAIEMNAFDAKERLTGIATQSFTLQSLNITVPPIDAWNAKPWISITPLPNASIHDIIPLYFNSGDSLNQGSITLTEWKHGTGDYIETSSPTLSLQLPSTAQSNYPVTIKVTDNDGNIVESTTLVTILQDAPVVSLTYSEATSPEIDSLFFTWSGTDQFGSITSYSLKEESDTTWTLFNTETTGSLAFNYTTGSFKYILQAIDDDHNTVSDTITVSHYLASYNLNGGDGIFTDQMVKQGGIIPEPSTAPTKQGYAFGGWYKESNTATEWNFTADHLSQDTVVFAKWNPINNTIQFDPNSGTGTMSSIETSTGSTTTLPPNTFTKAGYHFTGWAISATDAYTIANNTPYTMGTTGATLYATWMPNRNRLIFSPNTGSGIMGALEIPTDSTISIPSNVFAKAGYAFLGWSTEPTGSVIYNNAAEFTMGVATQTIYAIWQPLNNTVVFNENGGAGTMQPVTAATGDVVTLPVSAFVKAGYHFTGWAVTPTGAVSLTNEADYTMDPNGITLYAVWQPNENSLDFDGNGATHGTMDTQYASSDETITLNPNRFTRAGYAFLGWATTQNGSVIYSDGATNFTMGISNTVLFAVWSATANTISFNANGGSELMPSLNVLSDHIAVLPTNTFTKVGYRFDGWATSKNGTALYSDEDDIQVGTQNIALYATWTPTTNNIYFNPNGGTNSMLPQKAVSDAQVTLKNNEFTLSGHSFAGWARSAQGAIEFDDEASITMPTSNVTLWAQWNPNTYRITFEANSGQNAMNQQALLMNQTSSLSPNLFEKDGYTFAGWSLSPKGNISKTDGELFTMEAKDVSLYALWSPKQHTLKYYRNGATNGSMSDRTVLSDEYIALDGNIFTKSGYRFLGWSTSSQGQVVYDDNADFDFGHSNLNLYAQWGANENAIDFNSGGGSGSMTSITGNTDDVVTIPLSTFSRTGYTFSGWSETSGGNVDHNDGAQISIRAQSFTLYSVWSAIENSVEFNGNDNTSGTMPEQRAYTSHPLSLSTNLFEKDGYLFDGWSISLNGSLAYQDKQQITMPAEDLELFARWKADMNTITYHENGGSGTMPSSSAASNSSFTVPTCDYVRDGYTYRGWATSSQGPVEYNTGDQLSVGITDINLWAKWEAQSHTLSFNSNQGTGSVSSIIASTDDPNPMPPKGNIARSGYTFKGWASYPTATSVEYNPGETYIMGPADKTFYALWTPVEQSVTFTANGGSGSMADIVTETGASFSLPPHTFTREGFTFVKWEEVISGIQYNSRARVTISAGGLNLKAIWSQNSILITYNSGAGLGANTSQNALAESQTTLDTHPFSKQGYTFIGWSLTLNGSVEFSPGASIVWPTVNTTLYAQWSAGNTIITYNANSGVGTDRTQTEAADSDVALQSNSFTKAGYSLAGWALSQGGAVEYTDEETITWPTTDLSLYAVWGAGLVPIRFEANNGSGDVSTQQGTADQQKNIQSNSFTKEGYAFQGWSTSANGSVQYAEQQEITWPTTQFTLFAKWTQSLVTIHFNPHSGSGTVFSQSALADSDTKLDSHTFAKTGYTFSGWSLSRGGSVDYLNTAEIQWPTHTTTLYAVWTAGSIDITLNANGGLGNNRTQTGTADSRISIIPNTFSRTGYQFGGWAYSTTAQTADFIGGQEITWPTSATTLYAVWTPNTIALQFLPNLGSGSATQSALAGSQTALAPNHTITRTGYTLSGWSWTTNGTADYQTGDEITWPTAPRALYAIWDAASITIRLNSDGAGSPDQTQTSTADQATALKTTPFSRSGYTFSGWATTQGGTVTHQNGATITWPTATITLYAVWNAQSHAVTFNKYPTTGVGGATNAQSCNTGTQLTLSSNGYTRVGYTFSGWSLASGGTTVAYSNGAVINCPTTGTLSLYSMWSANTQTITYNSNGGSGSISSLTTTTGASVTLNSGSTFTKSGYALSGWATSANGAIAYTLSQAITMPANNLILYAKWAEIKVTSIIINRTSFSMIMYRDTSTLSAIAYPTHAHNTDFTWNSSAPNVATITSGIITVTGPGVTTISATADDDSGVSASITITVSQFKDNREFNLLYKMVRIGDQVWMASNLTYNPTTGSSICRDGSDYNCEEEYGRFYWFSGALNGDQASSANPSTTQGACPDHWHIPSKSEWEQLFTFVNNNANKLKSTTRWSTSPGTDDYGFNLLPNGMYHSRGGYQGNSDTSSELWSSNESPSYETRFYNSSTTNIVSISPLAEAFSIRCVMD